MSDLTTIILLGVVIILFLSWAIYLIFKFFKAHSKRKKGNFQVDLKKIINKNQKRNPVYPRVDIANSQIAKNYFEKKDNEIDLEKLDSYLKKEKLKLIKEFEEKDLSKYKEKALNILIEVMEKNAEKIASERTVFSIKLEDDSIKGKVIGKDGRNKRIFENITGTNIIIDPKEPVVSVSSPNPIRREIGKQLLEKLINGKNIEPNRIEKLYLEISNNFNNEIYDVGKNTIELVLGFNDINPELYSYVGRLKYRTSYGQNNLNHCIECASLAVSIAKELGLDEMKAKKAAFFHDIGKSLDFELSNDHVENGLELAKKYGLDDYVLNAIESHHEKILPNNIYSAIVKVVDSLSAARPGARTISSKEYFTRIAEIEKICKSFQFVKECYALKSGKQVRIIVDADEISDDDLKLLVYDIKAGLENNSLVNKQPIEIVAIREKKISIKTYGSAKRDNNLKLSD